MIQRLRKGGQRVDYLSDENSVSAEELAKSKGIRKIIRLHAGEIQEIIP